MNPFISFNELKYQFYTRKLVLDILKLISVERFKNIILQFYPRQHTTLQKKVSDNK
jgi:hypothetical protein